MSDTLRTDAESFDDPTPGYEVVTADFARTLERELAVSFETNRSLHRRVQEMEGKFQREHYYGWGYKLGVEKTTVRERAAAEKRLADYKHATRTEMAALREKLDACRKSLLAVARKSTELGAPTRDMWEGSDMMHLVRATIGDTKP